MPSLEATFQWGIRVYWEDTDAGGIVFYANYLKFFERSRTEWLRSLGIEQQKLRDSTGGMFVVAETSVRYLRPARLDDELTVTASLIETGRASIIIGQQVLLKSEHTTSTERSAGPLQASSAPNVIKGAARNKPEVNNVGAALLCHGTIRIGWVDAASLQPKRIPEPIIESLRAQK